MSGQGTPFGDGCGKGCVGVAALLAFWVAVFCGLVVAMGCQPVADNPPDPQTVGQCAELDTPPAGCEP